MAQIGRRDAIFPVLSSLTVTAEVTASLIPTSFERHDNTQRKYI